MYSITVSISIVDEDGWQGVRHLPHFMLDERVQGIMSCEHAERIARDIVDPFHKYNIGPSTPHEPGTYVLITAFKM